MSEISAVSSDSALLREGSRLLRQLARPFDAGDSVKTCQRRVHRLLRGWSWNRIRDVWRPDPRIKLKAHEIEQLRVIARQRRNEAAAVSDLRALQLRIERLETLLAATDTNAHGSDAAPARIQRGVAVRVLGTGNRS